MTEINTTLYPDYAVAVFGGGMAGIAAGIAAVIATINTVSPAEIAVEHL